MPGRPSACARCCAATATFRRCIFRAPSRFTPEITRSVSRPRRNRPAPASSRIPGRSRSIPRACASASIRRRAGCEQVGSVSRAVSETILPVSSYMGVTARLGEALVEAVRYRGGISDPRRGGDYYRIVEGNRLLWGSRIGTGISMPRGLGAGIERDIRNVYPQLGAVKVEQAWSGVMGYAVHKMPLIGEVM